MLTDLSFGTFRGMDLPPNPLDLIWSPDEREAARERCRKAAGEAADATIACWPQDRLEALRADVYRETIIESWLADLEKVFVRAVAIAGAPEAANRQELARHLVLNTKHSVEAARIVLRGSGEYVAVLPVGIVRQERVAALRRAASAPGGL